MQHQLIISINAIETQVALLEDHKIVELLIQHQCNLDVNGNIYKGRVQRVLPGMQAAFVDIGLKQAAFLYVDDIFCDFHRAEPHKIEELLKPGHEIVVQVTKSPMGTKGSRVTTYLSLPGQYLVLTPYCGHIGISRKIEDEDERQRLKDLVNALRSFENHGFIVRTASEGLTEQKFIFEMQFLNNLWQKIHKRIKTASVPSLLHQELDLILRAVRDLMLHDIDKLVIDSHQGYKTILDFIETFRPELKYSIEYYQQDQPIFNAFALKKDISQALEKKVWLKSGGYIIIEITEALVVIDVNTGRYVGASNFEETILKTNLEAVKEIAYQIRLRDLGGIIIIDFIDLQEKSNQETIFLALKQALKKDRRKSYVLPMSEIGLIQMTRKRIRKSLTHKLCVPCFYCRGKGWLINGVSICHRIFRKVVRYKNEIESNQLTLQVHPEIAQLLRHTYRDIYLSMQNIIKKQIMITPDKNLHIEQFDIF